MRWLLSYKQPTTEVERTTLRIKADWSGDIYLPVCWYTTSGTQACTYNWKVSIDAGTETTYSGTWGANTNIKVWFWLKPGTTHTVEIKPVEDEYGWCRALCYKDSTYASSLINIISDKSYKGYAKSAEESGDYYKYYQYAWCVNLLDTDNEVLPDSVHYLGNNYRAYEYLGCTSLKGNAQEKIFKQVRKIWTNYRANQYQNCSWMTTVRMRAINWCSTGSWFRSNMLSWVGSSSNKATLIIEWGIVEWGSWWIVDANINQILVYKGLVADYKTKLSWITASKIVNNPDWDTNNYEYLEFYINADANGDIKIPVAWYSNEWAQDCAYDWLVSVDGSDTTEYTWTGSATAITVGSWTAWSSHRILIYPKTEDWWWGRAFWFYNSWIASLLTEFIHDSFKCYADSYTDTWDYFRAYTFDGCVNLTNNYEKLPTSCDTVGDYYHYHDYDWCTSILTSVWEVMHQVTTMWESFRAYSFYNCSGLKTHLGIVAKPSSIANYPTDYRKEMFGNAGDWLVVNMFWYETLADWLTNAMWLTDAHTSEVRAPLTDVMNYIENANWSNLSASKFVVTEYPYTPQPVLDLAGWLELEWTKTLSLDANARPWGNYSGFYFMNCWLWVSDDEKYVYFPTRVDAGTWYDKQGIIWQSVEDLWVVTLTWTYWEGHWTWYQYASSPRWNSHDCEEVWIKLFENKWWLSLNRPDYTWYALWTVHWYSMSWNNPTFGNTDSWSPSLSQYHNKYTRWLWVDRNWYNKLATVNWEIAYSWRGWATENLGSQSWIDYEFSDDGSTCYILTWTTITQYNLTKPFQFKTRTSTGKTFSIPSWCNGFTIKWGHLYCNNWTTVYKYSIPNT